MVLQRRNAPILPSASVMRSQILPISWWTYFARATRILAEPDSLRAGDDATRSTESEVTASLVQSTAEGRESAAPSHG